MDKHYIICQTVGGVSQDLFRPGEFSADINLLLKHLAHVYYFYLHGFEVRKFQPNVLHVIQFLQHIVRSAVKSTKRTSGTHTDLELIRPSKRRGTGRSK
jgi:hypothetical protein